MVVRERVVCVCMLLQSCWHTSTYGVTNSTDGVVGNTTDKGEMRMPPVLHFQTWSRDPHNPVVMNYAWSTVGFPTLFISQSNGSNNCSRETLRITNLTEYVDSQTFGSVFVAGSHGDAAVAMVFRRLIEFDGGKKAKADDTFDSSKAAENSSLYHNVYLDNDAIDWWFDPARKSIIGKGGDLFGSLIFNASLHR